MKKIVIILITGLILLSCSTEETWETEVEEKINQINRDIKVTDIDLDQMEPTELDPDILIKPDTTHGINIGIPVDIIALGDSLYVLDQAQNSILALDESGFITREINREGKGPGEFTRPNSMVTNGEFVFAYDHGNTRLHLFDRYFRILTSISAAPTGFKRSISVADSLLYLTDAIETRTDEHLIKQYSIYPELKEKKRMVPRLLPYGRQPMVVNDVEFSANAAGYLVMGYDVLPRLFLYDHKGKLRHSLRFYGSPVARIDEFNKQNKRKDRLNPEGPIGLAPFLYSILLDDQFNIYLFTVSKNLFVLSLKENTYELVGSYSLQNPDYKGGIRASPAIFGDRLFLLFENFPDIIIYNLKRLSDNSS